MLLGRLVRAGRIERRMTSEELASRVGISRELLRRIETGDPRVSLGAAFEAAAIAGVPLFESELSRLSSDLAHVEGKLALLPKRTVQPVVEVDDEF